MSQKIQYFAEDIEFKLTKPSIVSEWIITICKEEKRKIDNINYIFCSDEYLLQINKKHLNHDYYTDIITFDQSEGLIEEPLAADIFISIDRIKNNSEEYKTTFTNELNRVIIHGILHLLGYNDKTPTQKDQMRKKENACLSLLKKKRSTWNVL